MLHKLPSDRPGGIAEAAKAADADDADADDADADDATMSMSSSHRREKLFPISFTELPSV